MRPAVATSSVIPPLTVGGSDILCSAAYSVAAAISTSTRPLASAASISARCQPKVCRPRAGRLAIHPASSARQERRRVGQHVARVGQQRQAAAHQAAQHLRCEHGQRQPQGERQPAATAFAIELRVVVPVVVGVRHAAYQASGYRSRPKPAVAAFGSTRGAAGRSRTARATSRTRQPPATWRCRRRWRDVPGWQ